jgi:hypothetical protein
MKEHFVMGVDLGQTHDYTALVILERAESEFHARHIERLSLGMGYPAQVERVAALVGSPQLAREVLIAVDGTGVGRAVVDLLRDALRPLQTPLTAITITGGATASRTGSRWTVPKRDLVAAAQVAIQTKRLKIAAALPSAQVLADELTAYRVTLSEDGRDSYGNGREAPHDDLVLALAIATYAATRQPKRTRITHVGSDVALEAAGRLIPDYEIPNDIFR